MVFLVLFVKYRGNFVWTQGRFRRTLLISSGWFVYQIWQTVICVCVLVRLTPAVLRIAQNRTVCLSFRDNVADWQRSSKATIRELFSAAREQETQGGHCFHLVRFAWPQCNNRLANCLQLEREHSAESWKQVTRSDFTSVYLFWEM